jgi:hypothetical protein
LLRLLSACDIYERDNSLHRLIACIELEKG